SCALTPSGGRNSAKSVTIMGVRVSPLSTGVPCNRGALLGLKPYQGRPANANPVRRGALLEQEGSPVGVKGGRSGFGPMIGYARSARRHHDPLVGAWSTRWEQNVERSHLPTPGARGF